MLMALWMIVPRGNGFLGALRGVRADSWDEAMAAAKENSGELIFDLVALSPDCEWLPLGDPEKHPAKRDLADSQV